MIDGHQLGLPGGSPGLGEGNHHRLGAYHAGTSGLTGLHGLGGRGGLHRGGPPGAETRESILRSPDFKAGSPALEGFIQDWLKAKGLAKVAAQEAK